MRTTAMRTAVLEETEWAARLIRAGRMASELRAAAGAAAVLALLLRINAPKRKKVYGSLGFLPTECCRHPACVDPTFDCDNSAKTAA
jgi:hypothetical protein